MSILSNVIRHALRAFGRREGEVGAEAADLRRVAARFPALAELTEAAAESLGLLAEPYRNYVTSVSSPAWAVSLQTASLLHALCGLRRPGSLLDLGSGFSSFTFRRYARDTGHACTVHSVDEDAQWLARTRDFLALHQLQAEGLFLWTSFLERMADRYEVILHDMGRLELRLAALPHALALAAPDGLVVLDDMHEPGYAPRAIECCHGAGFEVCSLRAITLDQFGRYACLAFRARGG